MKALLPMMQESMPAGIEIGRAFDASQNIRESIADVKFTLILTICLVIAVIFFFLRNVSATLIPSLAVPLSLLGTFAAMKLLGFTIDMLSMMAMTLSVGFVVDDAIVMLENIVRHMEMGKPRMQAAIDGAREVGFTIISMTVSLVAVFIPVLFMGGIIGRLLREFSVTIAIAVLLSGFISLTLTPMLCSRFLRHETHQHRQVLPMVGKVLCGLNNIYRRTLEGVLRHRLITLVASIVLTIGTVYLFVVMPKSFMPTVDQGFAFGGDEASEDTSFDKMVGLQQQANEVLKKNPWIESWGAGVGMQGGQNQGFMFMALKEDKHRPKVNGIIGQLSQEFMKIPGLMVFMQSPPLITLGQNEGRSQYSVALEDADTAELYKWAPVLEGKLRSIPQLTDIFSDLRLSSPRLNVADRPESGNGAGRHIRTRSQIRFTMRMGTGASTTITAASDQYDVMLRGAAAVSA